MKLVHVTQYISITDDNALDTLIKQLHEFSMVTMNIDSTGTKVPRVYPTSKPGELKLEGWRMMTEAEREANGPLFDDEEV